MPVARVVLLNLLLIAGGAAGGIAAQAVPVRELSDSALKRLIAKQERIRIRVGSGSPVELTQPRIEGEMLVGQLNSYGWGGYPIRNLDQVWRRGRSPDIGFAIGAGIGFVAGAAAVSSLSQSLCWGSCETSTSAVLGGGVIGGLTLGGFGALIGLVGVERWKSAYKAEGRKLTPVITRDLVGLRFSF